VVSFDTWVVIIAESASHARHQVGEVRLGDAVVDPPSATLRGEQAAIAHQAEVLAGGVGLDVAGLGELADGVVAGEEHLEHAEAARVRNGAQALRGAVQPLEWQQGGGLVWWRLGIRHMQ